MIQIRLNPEFSRAMMFAMVSPDLLRKAYEKEKEEAKKRAMVPVPFQTGRLQ